MEGFLRGAAFRGDLPTLQWILQQPGGVNVNAADITQYGFTALHYAVSRGHLAIVRAILQVEGVSVDSRTNDGFTPLHACTLSSNALLLTQALLEAGADPNAAHDDGATPLFFAANLEGKTVAEALLDGGANPAVRSNKLNTSVHQACFKGRLDLVELLIRRQGFVCLTWKNIFGRTPLDVLQSLSLSKKEAAASIGKHILQSYAGKLARRHGLFCLHAVLQDALFTDGGDEEFQLPVGKLNTEQLQMLLKFLIAAEPGSMRTLDVHGLLPLQVASELNFPDLVLNVLLRPYPAALLLI